jgi:hypothetical protein
MQDQQITVKEKALKILIFKAFLFVECPEQDITYALLIPAIIS